MLLLYPSKDELKRIKNRLAVKKYAASMKGKNKRKQYQKTHPESSKLSHKKWRKKNLLRCKQSLKTWKVNNRQHVNEYNKKYMNSIRYKEYKRDYMKSYRTKYSYQEYIKKWRKSSHGKIIKGIHSDARYRELGSEMLNEWFEGCNRHHINSQQIVCIPAELHRKYPHNHKKPETMVEINRIAMQYLFNCKA